MHNHAKHFRINIHHSHCHHNLVSKVHVNSYYIPMEYPNNLTISSNTNIFGNQGKQKIHHAVNLMKSAFSEILNPQNYENNDLNDPYVSFALGLCSKYNNDLDFQSIMQFPSELGISNPQYPAMSLNGIPAMLPTLTPNYLYPYHVPYIFPCFPPLPYLNLNQFTPDILENAKTFERLCMMGSTLLKYVIEATLFRKDLTFTSDEVNAFIKSIVNETSLSVLAKAYNIQLNYKFITTNVPGYKLILSYFGVFYDLNLKETKPNDDWHQLYEWCTLILGYNEENTESVLKQIKHNTSTGTSSQHDNNIKSIPQDTKASENVISDALNKYLHTVRQDFNQSKANSVDAVYEITQIDTPKPVFYCLLKINDVEKIRVKSISKKVAQAAATLVLAISDDVFSLLKRSSADFWFKRYTDNAKEIKALLDETLLIKVFKDPNTVDEDDNSTEKSVVSDRLVSPTLLQNSIEKDSEEEELKNAKNQLYAILGKYETQKPLYSYKQLPSGEFEATVWTTLDAPMGKGIGIKKKEAASRAALNYLRKVYPLYLEEFDK